MDLANEERSELLVKSVPPGLILIE